MDFFQEIFSEANFLATAMMILVLLYWAMMIFGVVGADMFDIEVDVDADVGIDADFDVDVDMDMEVDGNIATAGADIDTGSSTASAASGFMRGIFEFFYLTDVPVAIVGSTFAFGYWCSNVVLNHLFNTEQTFFGSLIWVIPSAIIGLAVVKIALKPIAKIAAKAAPEDNSRSDMTGTVGQVISSSVTESFGQIEVKLSGEPEVVYNARTAKGQELAKGDAAKIISYNEEQNTFLVELTKWENTTDE